MRNFQVLVTALDFIEEHLTEPFTQGEIADACFCSLSCLQKLFRTAFRLSLKEYATKRRLTLAARDLLRGGESVTDIALKYQYQSPEGFSRAFSRLWLASPSAFRRKWKFFGIFPKINYTEGDFEMTIRKRVDISELYDSIKSKFGTYILCFDICGLLGINAVSHEAGDKAILTCLERIDGEAPADMLLFRIGGDEFALVTGLTDESEARSLMDRILAKNGEPIEHGGQAFPLSMRAGAALLEGGPLRYQELFDRLHRTIEESRAAR